MILTRVFFEFLDYSIISRRIRFHKWLLGIYELSSTHIDCVVEALDFLLDTKIMLWIIL